MTKKLQSYVLRMEIEAFNRWALVKTPNDIAYWQTWERWANILTRQDVDE